MNIDEAKPGRKIAIGARVQPSFWLTSVRARQTALQIAVFGCLGLFVAWCISNALTNLHTLGMASGFGFLDRAAHFGFSLKLTSFEPGDSYWHALVTATVNTLFLASVSIVISTMLGFTIGICRLAHSSVLRRVAALYVEFTRNIPLLLFVYFWYFGVLNALPTPRDALNLAGSIFLSNRGLVLPAPTDLRGFGLGLLVLIVGFAVWVGLRRPLKARTVDTGHPERLTYADLGVGVAMLAILIGWLSNIGWDHPERTAFNFVGGATFAPEGVALVVALSAYTAAYIAEIVRGGILAVHKGQAEAARSLGLSQWQVLRLIVVPQALRTIVPPLTNQYINVVKNSAFGAVIGVPEVFGIVGEKMVNDTGQAIEPVFLVLAIYLVINTTLAFALNAYNGRIQRR